MSKSDSIKFQTIEVKFAVNVPVGDFCYGCSHLKIDSQPPHLPICHLFPKYELALESTILADGFSYTYIHKCYPCVNAPVINPNMRPQVDDVVFNSTESSTEDLPGSPSVENTDPS